jgi:PAT family acetyl-CoA transporter-like MFS transporter 1
VDSLYFKKFGRRKSWLVPVQYLIGFYMIYFSDFVMETLENDKLEIKSKYMSLRIYSIKLNMI